MLYDPTVSLPLTTIRARLFTGSFEAAIHLVSSICNIPPTTSILPVLNTNFAHHIAAGLADGTVIIGQNDISHPSAPAAASDLQVLGQTQSETEEQDRIEDANMPGTLLNLRKPALAFSKTDEEVLPSRIERLWYINPHGQEITIPANPRVLDALRNSSVVIYSIGSLFTSIIPSLILKGVGDAVSSPFIRSKILILNGTLDRETGPSRDSFAAMDFVAAIANACCESRGLPRPQMSEYWAYVTHVIYMDGTLSPKMDRNAFAKAGIEVMRVYGQSGKVGRYEAKALTQALEAIIGRKDPRGEKTRRNTVVT